MADDVEGTEPAKGLSVKVQDQTQPSKMRPHDLLTLLHGWWRLDSAHCQPWHKQAKEDFDFRASHGQWTEEERLRLQDQKRAPIVFNRILPMIKAVAGMEINGRHDVVFLPRSGPVDERGRVLVKANEMLSAASRWMDDTSDAEDHQSEAFQDMVTCGMGWSESLVSYDDDPQGLYTEPNVSPLEMYWDYRARMKNLTDRQRQWRRKRMLRSEAHAMFPDVPMEDLDCTWVHAGKEGEPVNDDPARRHKEGNNESVEAERDPQSEVNILQVQWWEYEPIWLVAIPEQPDKPAVLTDEEYKRFQAQAKEVEARSAELGLEGVSMAHSAVRGRRKAYRQAFIGKVLLGEVKPPQDPNGFTFHCVTGEGDKTKGTWFGLVSVARDPQRFANLVLSQGAHILNSTAKGGVIAEKDAFDDIRQAEATYARPDAITWAAPGAISKNKIMAKPGVGIAAGYVNLLEFAVSSIRDVLGINLEVLGMRDANQPGVLEAHRKQAAMTILATLFDSLRRYRRLIGRTRLSYIQRYLADGRMVRIAGDDGYELVQLVRDNVLGEYEVVISDAPTSPNQKQETWGIIQGILPAFQDMLTPEVVMLILEYSPLPSRLVDALKELSQQQSQAPEVQAQKQLAIAGEQAKVAKDDAAAKKSQAGAVLDLANAAATQLETRLQAAQAQIAEAIAQQTRPRMPDDAPMVEPQGPVQQQMPQPGPMPEPAETPMAPQMPMAPPGADMERVI